MISQYRDFYIASIGASSAFMGLLFVSISFIDSRDIPENSRIWLRIIANSAFSQLIDIFFVSLASLLPDIRNFALVSIIMAILGLGVSVRLLPAAKSGVHQGRRSPTVFGLITVAAYILQAITAVVLLRLQTNDLLLHYNSLAITILYAGALVRSWEITGIKKH